MKDTSPSWTARWVAWMRHLACELPAHEQLALDPYATRFVPAWSLLRLLRPVGFVRRNIYSMQLRTRFLDDEVRAYARDGGRQVLLLGAGFDTRGTRLALPGLRYFEVDHPATQQVKRAAMGDAPGVSYLSWHFERDPMSKLGDALTALGHEAREPTLVLWEGVTMYLTPEAIDDTLAAVRALGPGSRVAFNYVDGRKMHGLRWRLRPERLVTSYVGETFRFGFDPTTLETFLHARGLRLERDERYIDAAERYYGPAHRRRGDPWRRLAIARVP